MAIISLLPTDIFFSLRFISFIDLYLKINHVFSLFTRYFRAKEFETLTFCLRIEIYLFLSTTDLVFYKISDHFPNIPGTVSWIEHLSPIRTTIPFDRPRRSEPT
jgi:hypothetical protein